MALWSNKRRSLFCVVICFFIIFAGSVFYFISQEIKHPTSFIWSTPLFQKRAFQHNIKGGFRESWWEPFDSSLIKYQEVMLSSWSVIDFSAGTQIDSGSIWQDYNFVVKVEDIRHKVGKNYRFSQTIPPFLKDDFTNTLIVLKFSNARLLIYWIGAYNPNFTRLIDPYSTIDTMFLWGIHTLSETLYEGDFCIALYATAVLHTSWRNFTPDCHIFILPRLTNYPYAKLSSRVSPLLSGNISNLQVSYVNLP